MSDKGSSLLSSTMEGIFANSEHMVNRATQNATKHSKVSKRDLELALAVLLVDLAACDQHFDPQEYNIISNGLRRMFGTTKMEVQALVNQATQVLRNLRGTTSFATLLKEQLTENDRKAIMEIIEDVIGADGVEDGFEVYMRHRLNDLLGLPKIVPPAVN